MPGMSLTLRRQCSIAYTHTHMYNVSPMFDALAERFDDMDEIKDVADMAAPVVSPTSSTRQNLRSSMTSTRTRLSANLIATASSTMTFVRMRSTLCRNSKKKLVWCIVEVYCQQRVDAARSLWHPDTFKRVARCKPLPKVLPPH